MRHIAVLIDEVTEQPIEFVAWAEGATIVLEHPIDHGRFRHRFLESEAEQLLEVVSEAIGDARGLP